MTHQLDPVLKALAFQLLESTHLSRCWFQIDSTCTPTQWSLLIFALIAVTLLLGERVKKIQKKKHVLRAGRASAPIPPPPSWVVFLAVYLKDAARVSSFTLLEYALPRYGALLTHNSYLVLPYHPVSGGYAGQRWGRCMLTSA